MTKRCLVFFLVLAMIPVFLGIFCPCGMAAPTPEAGYKAAPCHGCCPEIGLAPEAPAEVISHKFLNTISPKVVQDLLKALSAGFDRDTALSRRDNLPAAGEPSPPLQNPLTLTQILRI